jgi:hypothetical protein
LRADRLAALRWFKRSVLLSLLLVQPFQFFSDEFGASSGLATQLVLWVGVNYLLRQERARRGEMRLPAVQVTPAAVASPRADGRGL